MKQKFKGFTLVELIVVMAILVILMAGIMQMFKPIRETYVDSTLYESQRTSQNGVVQYITESIRYATDLGIYTEVSGVEDAAAAFTAAYLEKNGFKTTDTDYSQKYNNTLKKVKCDAEIIIIDNQNDYKYSNQNYRGRILRRKFVVNNAGVAQPLTANAEKPGTSECRLALGAAYYGKSDYTITFDITPDPKDSGKGKGSEGIKVTVASNASYGNRTSSVIKNSGLVLCKNLDSPINGMFDISKYNKSNETKKNVYIVYINDKIEITATP